jgi:hypothetical protein
MVPNDASETPRYEELRAELDTWLAEGLTSAFWLRDDDAVADTPQLHQLLAITKIVQAQIAVAVIPKRVEASLPELLVGARCTVWQHGWAHCFHTGGEFGEGRPFKHMIEDSIAGAQAMDNLFGPDQWQRVFVPPNHMLALQFKARIHQLNYIGVSAGHPLTPPLPGILEMNAEIDVMDWYAGKILPESRLCHEVVKQLQDRRLKRVPTKTPIGILTHHLALDVEGWQALSNLMELVQSHPAAKFTNADKLFDLEPQDPLLVTS